MISRRFCSCDGVGQQARRGLHAFQRLRRDQAVQAVAQLGGGADLAPGIDAREHGVKPGVQQRAAVRLDVGPLDDLHA